MSKSKNLAQMTPDQIRERGRELLRIALQKETEIKRRQLLKLGEILHREIEQGWPAPWDQLATELEQILHKKIQPPFWGLNAPLAQEDGEV